MSADSVHPREINLLVQCLKIINASIKIMDKRLSIIEDKLGLDTIEQVLDE